MQHRDGPTPQAALQTFDVRLDPQPETAPRPEAEDIENATLGR